MRFAGMSLFLGLGVALIAPSVAASEPPPAHEGVRAQLRVGYARPVGTFEPPAKLDISNVFRHQTPFTLDLGYKLHQVVTLGAYGTVAFGEVGTRFESVCDAANCAVLGYRVGAMITFDTRPGERLNPWLGLAGGYQFSYLHIDARDGESSLGVRGLDLPQWLIGADYRMNRYLGFGPLLHIGLGTFTHRSVSSPTVDREDPIHEPQVHSWFTFGGRMVLFP